jgi:hypothetical protein
MPFRGQAVIHRPQPLHCSVSIVILPAIYAITHSFVSGSQKKILADWAVLVKQKERLL